MAQDDNRIRQMLTNLRSELEGLNPSNRGKVDGWVAKATPFIRKNFPADADDFIKSCRPGYAPPVSSSNGSGIGVQENHQQELNAEAKERTLGFVDGLIAISDGSSATANTLDTVLKICNGFGRFARQIKKRHNDRPTIEIVDEYDVQDLFHGLLKLHFSDVRAEEHTPSYAGQATRMDFLLKSEKIVVELKMTRAGLKDKDIGNQLIEDCNRYSQHPDCETLICYVYDPEHLLKNPEGLQVDLSKRYDGKVDVTVIVSSSGK